MRDTEQIKQNYSNSAGDSDSQESIMLASQKNASRSDEISLNDILQMIQNWLKYLKSRSFIIFILTVLGVLAGLAYTLIEKPVYTATTTFVLESGDGGGPSLGQYAGLASMVGIDIGGGGGGGIFQGDNIIQLYKSRSMIEKTFLSEIDVDGKKQLLIDRYLEITKFRKKKPELQNLSFDLSKGNLTRLQDSVIGESVKDINEKFLLVSKPDKKLSIIQVDVSSKDEIFAKGFNDQIVKNVNDFYVQTKTKKSLENVTILQQKTDSVRAVMNGAIYSVSSIADATPNLNPTRQVQRMAPMQRSQFTAETNKAILGELVKNLEMSKISLRKETPLIQIIDEPVFPLEKDEFDHIEAAFIGGLVALFLTIIFLTISKSLR